MNPNGIYVFFSSVIISSLLVNSQIQSCLTLSHIVPPCITLLKLNMRLCSMTVLHEVQNSGGLRLLLIDNVAAFYWLDRDCKGRHAGAGQPINNAYASISHILLLCFCILGICQSQLEGNPVGPSFS